MDRKAVYAAEIYVSYSRAAIPAAYPDEYRFKIYSVHYDIRKTEVFYKSIFKAFIAAPASLRSIRQVHRYPDGSVRDIQIAERTVPDLAVVEPADPDPA